eukprot:237718_1
MYLNSGLFIFICISMAMYSYANSTAVNREVGIKSMVGKALVSYCNAQMFNIKRPGSTSFDSSTVVSKPITDYINRMGRYAQFREECYVMALVYIDRLCNLNPEIKLNYFTVHRLIAT